MGGFGDQVLAQARVGSEDAEEADQVDAGRGHEGGEAAEEFEGLEDELRLAGRVQLAYERGLIVAALDSSKGNQSEAARLLDMSRATLQDKIRKYGLNHDPELEPEG